jgi:uncharacterized small protein (DUF1192 family)
VLQNKLLAFEEKIAMMASEIERLNTVNRELNAEKERAFEKSLRADLLLREKEKYEEELKKVRELLDVKFAEIDSWRGRYAQLERQIPEYERKVELLVSKLEHSNSMLETKYRELGGAYEQNVRINELEREKGVLEAVLREYQSREAEFFNALSGNALDNNSLVDKLHKYEERIILITAEVERLSLALRTQRTSFGPESILSGESIYGERPRLILVLKIIYLFLSLIEREKKSYPTETVVLEGKIQDLRGQIEDWRRRFIELQNYSETRGTNIKVTELDQKVFLLNNELERVNMIVREKFAENDALAEKLIELQVISKERGLLLDQVDRLRKALDEQIAINNDLRKRDEINLMQAVEGEKRTQALKYYEEKVIVY